MAAREILLLGALKEAREAASRAGMELVPLKGAALLELGIYTPGERGMTDVDVLLRRRDLPGFEKILAELGYLPMPDSAEAWFRPSPGNVPPAIMDLHTALWHIKDTGGLFEWGLEPGPEGLALNLPDLFLHAAVHPLLHHGELKPKNTEDCRRIAAFAQARNPGFWPLAARKAASYSLRPAAWPVIKRLRESGAVSAAGAAAFEPRGLEKIKAAFFEKAAVKRSAPLEYLLPVLYRPGLALQYLVPEPVFMRRRYGSASAAAYLLRPLRLLRSVFFGN